jgi:hypothetical protein
MTMPTTMVVILMSVLAGLIRPLLMLAVIVIFHGSFYCRRSNAGMA